MITKPGEQDRIEAAVAEAREIIADGDAHGYNAKYPTSIKVRQLLEQLCTAIAAADRASINEPVSVTAATEALAIATDESKHGRN